MAGPPRAAECKGRHGRGEAAGGADDPLHGASTGARSPQVGNDGCPDDRPAIKGRLIIPFLASNPAFEGIGVARASALWEAFGDRLYGILGGGEAGLLAQVVGQERAEALVAAWREQLAEGDVVVWLDENGFDRRLGMKVVRFWGAEAPRRLRDNPYVLIAVAPWEHVDAAARRLGVAADDPRRLIAAVEAALYGRLDRSHTLTPALELEAAVARLLRLGKAAGPAAIHLALRDGAAVELPDGFQPVGAHVMERYVAEWLRAALRAPLQDDLLIGADAVRRALDALPEVFTAERGVTLNMGQRAAVSTALTNRVLLLLGGAGVGKTTALAAIHAAAERCGLVVRQMALSGRAALRMREATGRQATTIAGFLYARAKGDEALGANHLIVVDEASMLDLPLLYSILRHLPGGCRLLLVGDPHQLPPIRFGLTFHVMAESPDIPRVELTEVHRQAAATGIPAASLAIRHGRVPELAVWRPCLRTGVSFLECAPEEVPNAATDVLADMGGIGAEARILSAVRAGPAGVEAINLHLHRLLSAGRATHGRRALAVGDPVVFGRNLRDRGLLNGSLGTVLEVDGHSVVADFDGQPHVLDGPDLDHLALGYCLTVHKAQGSQFRRVAVITTGSRLLDRTLLYTAVTRATEQVVIVGDRRSFEAAVVQPPISTRRQTGFSYLLAQAG